MSDIIITLIGFLILSFFIVLSIFIILVGIFPFPKEEKYDKIIIRIQEINVSNPAIGHAPDNTSPVPPTLPGSQDPAHVESACGPTATEEPYADRDSL